MKPASGTRKPYNGLSRSLVLALDIGTTFSGVSYAILEPGEVPKIHGVTRFPGQEHVAGNSKIPSIMYYDRAAKMVAAGAEAESASIVAEAEDENWLMVELFKLRLRPKAMKLKMNGMRFAPLPRGKNAVDVFGDFLAYLFQCTRSFIVDTHANGLSLWRAVEHDIQFVLSHPNGWEGAQQTKMRRAAVYGGLIPDTDEGKARIRFVTEGEASLHACVLNGLAADVLQNPSGHGFIVADAGGGTLDISSYAIRGSAPLVIEEIAPPDCVFAGSVFVSRRARAFFEEKLKASKYGTPDSLDHITKRFDETTKRLFRDNKELQFVPFGSPLDKDPTVGIRGGQLKLTGAEVAALFEPSIESAVASIKAQIQASGGAIKSVWLVGGFAASPWLFSQLQERLTPLHVTVSRPDSQTSKAVADGAIGFYCDHHVSARMSKFMYGVEYLREFNSEDEEHVARQHRLFELPSGPKLLPDAFDCILSRGLKVKESTVFSRKYCTEVTNIATLSVFEVELWCYRGGDTIPKWILRNKEDFSTLCYVRADLSPLAGSAQAKPGKSGKTYYNIVFNIEIHFGLTEFRARIKWIDNGKTRYGPASIVYNESGHRAEEDEPDDSPEDHMTIVSSQSDYPSQKASRAPSRDPTRTSSRHSHSAQPTPKIPSMDVARSDLSRSSSIRSTARTEIHSSSATGKGKEREIIPETPRAEPMREVDRSINTSGRSMASTRSGSTQLGETLSSVWGASSKQQSPLPSPLGGSVRSSMVVPRDETAVVTPREASKVATPKEVSKAATPRDLSYAATPKEISHAATPKEVSKAATPRDLSRTPTPKDATRAPTPKEVSKPPTPKEASKASTPQEVSVAPTPKSLSKASTPKGTSKAPTPKTASKASTPKEASKAPTPAATSKAASKASTPKSASKVPTPRTDTTPLAEAPQYPSPYDDAFVPPPPTWNMPPASEPEQASEPAALNSVPQPEPEPALGVTLEPIQELASAPLETLAEVAEEPEPAPAEAQTASADAPGGWDNPGGGDDWDNGGGDWGNSAGNGSTGDNGGGWSNGADNPGWFTDVNTTAPPPPPPAGLSDLLSSPGQPAGNEARGLFSDFLSNGPAWGTGRPKSKAGSSNGGGSLFGGFGSTLFGSGMAANQESDSAKAEEARKLEEAQKAEEEKRAQEATQAEAARLEAEEAEKRKLEEETRKAEEEAAESKRKADEAETTRLAEEAAAADAAKLAEEATAADAARLAEETAAAEAKRIADDEAAAEAEANKQEEEESARQAEETAAAETKPEESQPELTAEAAPLVTEVEVPQPDAEANTAANAEGEGANGEEGAGDDPAENVDGENAGDGEQKEEEDWGIPVKKIKKKGKKGNTTGDAASTPQAVSRSESAATTGDNSGGGPGKKKGKKKK